MDATWMPGLSPAAQAAFRSLYGLLLLLTLVEALPQARRFFLSERWGGYARSEPRVDLAQNPVVMPGLLAAWLAAAALLVAGRHTLIASLVNLLLCRYFFVAMRWKGILRGMGAPGFMTYWLAAVVFLLEWSTSLDLTGSARAAAVLAVRVDFAVIMLCAGTYKVLAGYPKNEGMELGLVNPWWGYWWRQYRRLPPAHWLFRTLNHLAYATEIGAGLLMLYPPTAFLGALLILVSFAFIATQIRLGFLTEMVMLATVLFLPAGHPVDRWLARVAGDTVPSAVSGVPSWVSSLVVAALVGYIALLPLAKFGQYWNLLAGRRLPGSLQATLDRYTNFFAIIIWRVFSVDIVNFHARISVEDAGTGVRRLYARPGVLEARTGFRYVHVGEFICLASLFTTLKYYPDDSELFRERLVRYARTVVSDEGSRVIFEYLAMRKDGDRFHDVPVAEWVVDPSAGTVTETVLNATASLRTASAVSPVHPTGGTGSYAPASGAPAR